MMRKRTKKKTKSSFSEQNLFCMLVMELFIMIVDTQQIYNISAYNIHVCETIVDQDMQRL